MNSNYFAFERYQCRNCKRLFTLDQIKSVQAQWDREKGIEPQQLSLIDLLYRECHVCGSTAGFDKPKEESKMALSQEELAQMERETASQFLKIEPYTSVIIHLKNARRVESKFDPGKNALKFDVIEVDYAPPLKEKTTYEISSAALQRTFIDRMKDGADEFYVEIKRTGADKATRYTTEFMTKDKYERGRA